MHLAWAALAGVGIRHFDVGLRFLPEIGLDVVPRSSRGGFQGFGTCRIDPWGSRGPKRTSGGRKRPPRTAGTPPADISTSRIAALYRGHQWESNHGQVSVALHGGPSGFFLGWRVREARLAKLNLVAYTS